MIETFVLLVGAIPFAVGLYALKKINENGDDRGDDEPPPPDPDPPLPVLPPSPRQHRSHRNRRRSDRPARQLVGRRPSPLRRRTPQKTYQQHPLSL